jgi:hypothetical protein
MGGDEGDSCSYVSGARYVDVKVGDDDLLNGQRHLISTDNDYVGG